MDFLTFLGYFIVANIISEVILQCLIIGYLYGKTYLAKRQLNNMIKDGTIKFLTKEEFAEMMEKEDKKTWN